MDMLAPRTSIDLADPSWPIYARTPIRPPHFIGPDGVVAHSLVTGGSEVYGTVENSILFHSVTVEEGAQVRYSILMPGVTVRAGAKIEYAIIAENAVIEPNACVGTPPDPDNSDWGVTVVAGGVTVGEKAVVPAHAMVRENVEGGEQV